MYYLNKLIRRLLPRRLPPPTAAVERLIEQLRETCRALEAGEDGRGREAHDFWADIRRRLRERIVASDPRDMMNFPEIRQTMFVDAPPYITAQGGGPGAVFVSRIEEVDSAILARGIDLFIGNWSISETPIGFRSRALEQIHAAYWLIGFQAEFGGVDNVDFFSRWTANRAAWHWRTIPIPHHATRQYYLLGSPAPQMDARSTNRRARSMEPPASALGACPPSGSPA